MKREKAGMLYFLNNLFVRVDEKVVELGQVHAGIWCGCQCRIPRGCERMQQHVPEVWRAQATRVGRRQASRSTSPTTTVILINKSNYYTSSKTLTDCCWLCDDCPGRICAALTSKRCRLFVFCPFRSSLDSLPIRCTKSWNTNLNWRFLFLYIKPVSFWK